MTPAVFVILVLLSVPGRFTGKVAALEPAGERPGLTVSQSVLFQFHGEEETFPTDVADVLLQLRTVVHRGQMILRKKIKNVFIGK